MQTVRIFRIVTIMAAFMLTTCMLAGAKDSYKGDFHISSAAHVNGKQLPAGDYVAQWQGSGPDVRLDILKDGKVVASVPARVMTLDKKSPNSSAEIINNASGNGSLSEIRFSGKTYVLQLGEEAAQAQTVGDKPASK